MEEWKPLTYHGEWFGDTYEVSSQGKIKNISTGRLRKLSLNKQGYLYCVISRGRKRKIAVKVHRAVAENFVQGNADGLVINHKDCNKKNNNADNLEFVTVYKNNQHAIKNGLVKYQKGSEASGAKLNDNQVREIRKIYESGKYNQHQIADMYGMSHRAIWGIVHRKSFVDVY